jgi:phosphatidylinositol phospholipase C delta
MPLFTPSGKQVSLYKLMAMSTLISPTHGSHMRPLIQAGGGDASSDIPDRQWYLCHAIQECLEGVYDSLRGSDHLLTRQKFEAWLFAVQGQTIASFEKNEYKFEEYYISSSHNTYLSGNQLSSRSSTESYKNVSDRNFLLLKC